MKRTKISMRIDWITANVEAITAARNATDDHTSCKGRCNNGATCKAQSGGGYGFWVQAFRAAGVECYPHNYWSGSSPTPSTSINRGIAAYIAAHAPDNIR